MGIFDSIGKSSVDREITKYEKLASEKPENPSIRNALGDLYLKKGASARAAQYYRETVELFQKTRQYEKAVALMRKLIGYDLYDLKEMEAILSGFLSRGKKSDVISLYTQFAKKKQGISRPLANDVFRKILELDPANPEAMLFFGQGKQDIEEALDIAPKDMPEASRKEGALQASPEAASVAAPEAKKPAGIPKESISQEKPGQQIRIRIPERPAPQRQPEASDKAIQEKFIDLAKEKKYLETTILQQNDVIRKLEREKTTLAEKISALSDANSKLKDKLVDFDIVRNMEVAELKKKFDDLIGENNRLLHEREQLLKTLDDDQQRSEVEAGLDRSALAREKEDAERLLLQTQEELRLKDAAIARTEEEEIRLSEEIRQAEAGKEAMRFQILSLQEEAEKMQLLLQSRETDLEEVRMQASEALLRAGALEKELAELTARPRISPEAEQELRDLLLSREQEVRDLKIDIDELTHSMEAKIHEADQLKAEVSLRRQQLEQKEKELNDQIPALRSKINRLSEIIDYKLEEHSLFAKELADVNEKLLALHEEINKKDELLTEISQGYRQEQAQLQEISTQHVAEKNRLQKENEELRKGLDEMRDSQSSASRQAANIEAEKRILEEQLSEALKKVLELEHAVCSEEQMREKDRLIAEMRNQLETERGKQQREVEILTAQITQASEDKEELSRAMAALKESHALHTAALMREIEEKTREHERVRADGEAKDRMVSEITKRHEAEVLRLGQEAEALQATLREIGGEREAREKLIAEIKQDLHREVVPLVIEIEGLKEEKTNLLGLVGEQKKQIGRFAEDNSRLAGMLSETEAETRKLLSEKADALSDARREINSCNRTIAELKARLESTLQEKIQAEEEPSKRSEKSEPPQGRPEERPAAAEPWDAATQELLVLSQERTVPEKKRIRWSYVLLPVGLAGIIFGGILFYQNRLLIDTDSQVTVQKVPEAPKPLSYHELFDRLTREQKTEFTRVQATMIADTLLKAEPERKDDGGFRIDAYRYFKITVNSLKGDLNREFIESPESLVRMISNSGALSPDKELARKEMKVFSRRDQPVSFSFLAAFPVSGFEADMSEISIAVTRNQEEIRLSWDLQELKAQKIIP